MSLTISGIGISRGIPAKLLNLRHSSWQSAQPIASPCIKMRTSLGSSNFVSSVRVAAARE